MKARNPAVDKSEPVKIPMTPMIDIVFQLLVFFVMTFKIVSQEGDFNVRMPQTATREAWGHLEDLPPMTVRMQAAASGDLAQVSLNDRIMDGKRPFRELHDHIRRVIGDDRGPGSLQQVAEVELVCDYDLRYEYVIDALTAVSGYLDGGGNIVNLVERTTLSPPRQAP